MKLSIIAILSTLAAVSAFAPSSSTQRTTVAMNAEPVVYGVYDHGDPDPVLVRCWQQINKEWVEVDKRPCVTIPLKAERALLTPKPIKVLVGGRGSGKSEMAAAISAARVKDEGIKVG